MFQSILSALWPTGDGRFSKLYRGAAIAVAGTLLTYLTSYVTQTDFGQWTPAVVACWSVVANALRQAVGKLSEGEEGPGVSR